MKLPDLPEARIVSNQYDSTMRVTTLHTYDAADMRAYAEEAVRLDREKARTHSCPSCGTHEVELTMTCHNSACGEYARGRTFYEGWKQGREE